MKNTGTKEEVFYGLAKQTTNGLTRNHLIIGHNGKVVAAPTANGGMARINPKGLQALRARIAHREGATAKGGKWDLFHLGNRGKPFFFSH